MFPIKSFDRSPMPASGTGKQHHLGQACLRGLEPVGRGYGMLMPKPDLRRFAVPFGHAGQTSGIAPAKPYTALIVGGEPDSRDSMRAALETIGIDCIQAESGAAMWHALAAVEPDLIILDFSLPDYDGLDLLHRLRVKSEIPVLIHTKRLADDLRIACLEEGADGFLGKPCHKRELLARSRNLLRFAQRYPLAPGNAQCFRFGDWTVNLNTRSLICDDGREGKVGVPAFALLRAFVAQPFRPLSRRELAKALGREYEPYDRNIDVHVSMLRRTLGSQPDGKTPYIKTLHAEGYMFVASVATV